MNTSSPINKRDGEHISAWQNIEVLATATDENNVEESCDTLIVGAGITGLTTGLLLQQRGQRCIIVDAQNPGYGTTGGTSAHLNTFLDSSYPEIDSDFGEEASKQMAKASAAMIALIKKNIDDFGIDADFEYKKGYLFAQNDEESKTLSEILSSSKKAGVIVSEADTNDLPIDFQSSLCFEQQAQFHPLKYIKGIADEFIRLGGKIFTETFIEENTFENGIHHSKSAKRSFVSKNLVYATHISPGVNILSLRNAPYRSYILAVKLKGETYPEHLSYDLKEPYHYFRSHVLDGQKLLLIGGADHKTGHEEPEKAFEELESYVRTYFDVEEIAYRWSSQYYVPVDGLPYIGQLPGGDPATYVATGFNGNGMILGSLSATIIADLITEQKNEYSELLSPARLKPVAGFSEFVKENADVAYRFVADRFGSELKNGIAELEAGDGKILKVDDKKLAVYKDDSGKVTGLNPVCTHAGCIVHFNREEKSWDCPCHGARYDIEGNVVTGPARKNLEKISLEAPE